jgi:hypothetical protein
VWLNDIPLRSWVRQAAVTLSPLGATLTVPAGRQPSEIPSQTRSVSVFLPGRASVGPRSFGEVRSGSCHTHTIFGRARKSISVLGASVRLRNNDSTDRPGGWSGHWPGSVPMCDAQGRASPDTRRVVNRILICPLFRILKCPLFMGVEVLRVAPSGVHYGEVVSTSLAPGALPRSPAFRFSFRR